MLHDAPPSSPHATEPPVYADRETGANYRNAFEMVNAYIARFCERPRPGLHSGPAVDGSRGPSSEAASSMQIPPLDGTGYTQGKRGSAHIGINVLEDNGVLMMLAPIMEVPVVGREMFYRRLLELSFLATSDAAFAIDGKNNEVYVRALRRLSGLDYEEFEDLLQTVAQVADDWDDVLTKEYGT